MEYRINTKTGRIWARYEWEVMDKISDQKCIHWNHLDPISIDDNLEEVQKKMYAIYGGKAIEDFANAINSSNSIVRA